jgi:hypothetical protein
MERDCFYIWNKALIWEFFFFAEGAGAVEQLGLGARVFYGIQGKLSN